MAGLKTKAEWSKEVYQIETTDPVMGGENGVTNKPAKDLGNRTEYLKKEQDKLKDNLQKQADAVNEKIDANKRYSDNLNFNKKELTTQHLNSLLIPGVYAQASSSRALLNRGYPTKEACSLAILPSAHGVQQIVYPYFLSVFFKRNQASSGIFGPWTEFKASSVDYGNIIVHASTNIPHGYLECNGALISKNNFSKLFAVIGERWGKTLTHFRLPDLRGEFVRGWDHGRGIDKNRDMGATQTHAFQTHAHYLPTATGNDDMLETGIQSVITDTGLRTTSVGAWVPVSRLPFGKRGNNKGIASGSTTRTYSSHVAGGYNSEYETRPTNVALIYLIRAY